MNDDRCNAEIEVGRWRAGKITWIRQGRGEEGHEEVKKKLRGRRITRGRRECVMVKRGDRRSLSPTCPSLSHTAIEA